MTTGKILVSACLLGQKVRYGGSAKTVLHPTLTKWQQDRRLVALCPEIAAGFATPRAPAEIAEGLNAHWFMSLEDARQKLEEWRRYYNEDRPHSAIGQIPPILLHNPGGVSSPSQAHEAKNSNFG